MKKIEMNWSRSLIIWKKSQKQSAFQQARNSKLLSLLFFAFFFTSLSSCSLFPESKEKFSTEKEEQFQIIHQSLKGICLAGEGKSEIFQGKKRYQAGFESLWNFEEKEWKSALNVPLYGEETFFVNYQSKKVVASGSLWDKRADDIQMENFVEIFAILLNFFQENSSATAEELKKRCLIDENESDGRKILGSCDIGRDLKMNIEILSDLNIKFLINVSDKLYFEVITGHFNREENYYDQISFKLNSYSNKKGLWSLKIFLSKCEKS